MYSAKSFIETPKAGGVKIPVGIHSGVSFSGIIKEPKWFDIQFSNDEGRSIYKRVFAPTGSRQRDGESIQDSILREEENCMKALTEVMVAVLDKEVVENFTAPTFSAFVEGATYLLNMTKGVKVNIKVVPDYKEKIFPELPYSRFVEKHVVGEEPKLKFSKKDLEDIETMVENREKENSKESEVEKTDTLF